MFLIRAYISSCCLGGKEGNVAKNGNLESGPRFPWLDWNPHPKSHNISYRREWREGIESQQVLHLPFYAIRFIVSTVCTHSSTVVVMFFIGEQAFAKIWFPRDCHKTSYSSSQLLQVDHFLFHLLQYWFLEIFLDLLTIFIWNLLRITLFLNFGICYCSFLKVDIFLHSYFDPLVLEVTRITSLFLAMISEYLAVLKCILISKWSCFLWE